MNGEDKYGKIEVKNGVNSERKLCLIGDKKINKLGE